MRKSFSVRPAVYFIGVILTTCSISAKADDAVTANKISFIKAVRSENIDLMKRLLTTPYVRVNDDISGLAGPNDEHYIDIAISQCLRKSVNFLLSLPVLRKTQGNKYAIRDSLYGGCYDLTDIYLKKYPYYDLVDVPTADEFDSHKLFLESYIKNDMKIFDFLFNHGVQIDDQLSFQLTNATTDQNQALLMAVFGVEPELEADKPKSPRGIDDPPFYANSNAKTVTGHSIATVYHYRCSDKPENIQAMIESVLVSTGGKVEDIPERPWYDKGAKPYNGPRCWGLLRSDPYPR